MDDALEHEFAVYRKRLKKLYPHEGEYVVIRGDTLLGFYPDLETALEAGYDAYDSERFFVKLVCLDEQPGYMPVRGPSHAERPAIQKHPSGSRGVSAHGHREEPS